MFTKDMQVVTLGTGLVTIKDVFNKCGVNALLADKSTVKLGVLPIWKGRVYEVTIHSEDTSIEDIKIKCSEGQVFRSITGDFIEIDKLKGQRLRSLGQSSVYCTEVREAGYGLLYQLVKLERAPHVITAFINGIEVLI